MQYEEVVKMIKDSEARVDEVLKAARLERRERAQMPRQTLITILNYIVGIIAMVLGFGLLYFIVYFMGN